jgi:hypothetical protein
MHAELLSSAKKLRFRAKKVFEDTPSGFTSAMIGALIGHGPPDQNHLRRHAFPRCAWAADIALTTAAAIRLRSAATNGLMMPGCPTLSRVSSVAPAAIAARMCGVDFNWNRQTVRMMGYR